jgi:hypothetical protein
MHKRGHFLTRQGYMWVKTDFATWESSIRMFCIDKSTTRVVHVVPGLTGGMSVKRCYRNMRRNTTSKRVHLDDRSWEGIDTGAVRRLEGAWR